MTVIDDCSRWCEVFFLKFKDETPSKIIEYMRFVEKQTGLKVKAVQFDNGTEYCNRTLDSFFKTEGIQRRLSTAHTPQQNGVAERKNRTLVESARCMLTQANLPHTFWAEAIAMANYIRNRCISKSLNQGTPYEVWTDEKPNIEHLRVFGSKVYVADNVPNKGKFQLRATEGIFLGYSNESKAYRVWIPSIKKIRISRDVKFFDEHSSENEREDIANYDRTSCSDMTPDVVHSTTKEIAINPRTGEDIEHIAVDEPDVSVHDQPIE